MMNIINVTNRRWWWYVNHVNDTINVCNHIGSEVNLAVWKIPDERYSVTGNGLIVRNVTELDNGNYTCRGEVGSDGRYAERAIIVTVHSKLWLEPGK